MSDLTAEELRAILDEKLAPISSKMCDTQNSMDLINEKYEEIKNRIALNEEVQKDINNENEALKNQLRIATKKIDDLRATCNDLEHYSRRESVKIRGMPIPSKRAGSHSPGENTNLIVTKVAEVIGVDLEIDEISVSHRLKTSKSYHRKNTKSPPLIAKFVRRNTKEKFYKARKTLYTNNIVAKDLGLGYVSTSKISVVESLTVKNKELFQRAYEFKCDHNFQFLWTSSGNIFPRRSGESQVIPIKSLGDLGRIRIDYDYE